MRVNLPKFRFFAALGLLAGLLAACYLPNHFVAEIRLGQTGDFALYYKGDLTWAPLYRDIKRGQLEPAEIEKRIAGIQADLARDPDFKSIRSQGDGVFAVEYQREGRMGPSEQVTFVRRNAIILMIRAHPDGRVTVNANTVKPSDAQMATSVGLDVQGEFRVTTKALVLRHNATTVETINGYPVYIWKIQNAFSPPPFFEMRREGAFPAQGQSQP